jgi:hypothetical protein
MKGSLIATTATFGFAKAQRKTKRPMRPKPLIPILIVILLKDELVFCLLVDLSKEEVSIVE